MTPDLPERFGLAPSDLVVTAQTIANLQLESGMIPWFPNGHTDPWNHVEAAMALATCGLIDEAAAAYDWLAGIQRPDGAWCNYYVAGPDGETVVEDDKLDANCVAYLAAGIHHLQLTTGDNRFVERYWPSIERAIEFVLRLQTERGEILWARHPDGRPWEYALKTSSSSVAHSLGCAIELGAVVGFDTDRWTEARDRLISVVGDQPQVFEPKDRWAMDWYYPVLVGAVTGDDAYKMLLGGWDTFVMEGRGVRCVSDRPWITAAETCECAIAHLAAGEQEKAEALFAWSQALRADDGSYFTGRVFPEEIDFPDDERSAYTAAAVILAADALFGGNPTSDLFL